MINAKLQSIIDTKSAIGNAIVNKGGTITGETPFFNYAAQINNISTGTPQTIFTASDGSKWARTNAVNLTNVSNNVTSDFNWWQPANNSTSNAILNVGTVNGNISGNIRIVQVNQVNIAQYTNIVINDTTGAKYVGYNGYDSVTNPTPTGNTTFNRWLLNNSASGTIIFANTTVTNGGTYNGPNSSLNEASMPFIANSVSYGGAIRSMFINNGSIYVVGNTNQRIKRYNQNNLAFVDNSANTYADTIQSVCVNNSFVYIGGDISTAGIRKFHESNLVLVSNSQSYGGEINNLITNNGFIYAGGAGPFTVQKFHESNLTLSSNSASYGGFITEVRANNGFIYAGGSVQNIKKYHESNLAFQSNSANYGGVIFAMAINNGFVYIGGSTNLTVKKYHESNLAFVGNTNSYGGTIQTITTNNGFLYVGGSTNSTVQKFYESNLAFVGNTVSYGGGVLSIIANNGTLYVSGDTNNTIQTFNQSQITFDNQTFYTATKIKE
jgi:uncharacterized protein YggL (DUF469 family)